ncbi:uncharacterized protein LOC116848824 [Odontomachus brunneus]|uniref:uncharacterized protein LOC116848824 n=1 Tax=Odontomachus brunneus TaxID=486640 RepID=UPI0013F1BE91|nr:uncharacterized protein LOC116848824 [Odontomachus brunneus]
MSVFRVLSKESSHPSGRKSKYNSLSKLSQQSLASRHRSPTHPTMHQQGMDLPSLPNGTKCLFLSGLVPASATCLERLSLTFETITPLSLIQNTSTHRHVRDVRRWKCVVKDGCCMDTSIYLFY